MIVTGEGLVRGCLTCMTQFEHRVGRCPLCGAGQIDTYNREYWDAEMQAHKEYAAFITGGVKKVQEPTKTVETLINPTFKAIESFKADILRVCRIHGYTLIPEGFGTSVHSTAYFLTVKKFTQDKDLEDIERAY